MPRTPRALSFSAWILVVEFHRAAGSCAMAPSHLSVDNKALGHFEQASDLAIVTDGVPWLSWWLSAQPGASNLSQSAYRLQVASNATGFDECDSGGGPACLWDSGVVQSRDQGVPYGGSPLPSLAQALWRVAVWDGTGEPCGPGTEVGAWEVPLLTEDAWHGAVWLTRDAPHQPLSDCEQYNPNPAPLFRAPLILPPGAKVKRARAYVSGLGYYLLYVDGSLASDAVLDPGQTSYNATVLYATHDSEALRSEGGSLLLSRCRTLPVRCFASQSLPSSRRGEPPSML